MKPWPGEFTSGRRVTAADIIAADITAALIMGLIIVLIITRDPTIILRLSIILAIIRITMGLLIIPASPSFTRARVSDSASGPGIKSLFFLRWISPDESQHGIVRRVRHAMLGDPGMA